MASVDSDPHLLATIDVPSGGKVRIQTLEERYLEEWMNLMASVFCNSPTEPIHTSLGTKEEEMMNFLRIVVKTAIPEDFSCVALNDDGEVVGAFLLEDFGPILRGEPPCEELRQLMVVDRQWDLLLNGAVGHLEEVYSRHCKDDGITKIVHYTMAAVSPSYRGLGISVKVFRLTCDRARERGYERVIVETSNLFSRNLARAVSAHEVYSFDLEAFEYGGERTYEGSNDRALAWLKENGLYKESYGDDICQMFSIYEIDL